MRLLAALLVLVAFPAFGQTCPAGPADPVPRDAVRLNWNPVTTNTDGSTITSAVTYSVYERVGASDVLRCTTTATSAGQTALAVGTHSYVVTAKVGPGPESSKSNVASKAIDPPPTPIPTPPTITIASTRIDQDTWTCRDAGGVILSRHERQDKAQESCSNFALANLGKTYEMRPSGFRIVASAR